MRKHDITQTLYTQNTHRTTQGESQVKKRPKKLLDQVHADGFPCGRDGISIVVKSAQVTRLIDFPAKLGYTEYAAGKKDRKKRKESEMDDSVLWAVALGTGALGLLLLTIAGVVAMYLNTRARETRDAASADEPQSHTGDVASTGESQLRAASPSAKRTTAGGFWAWVKAWVFASIHAGTVSLVLGGITFFEDIARASDEIQRTGTVTFPKQLLPGTLAGSASRKRLSRPSDDLENPDQPGAPPPGTAGWEVVGLLDEADAEDDG